MVWLNRSTLPLVVPGRSGSFGLDRWIQSVLNPFSRRQDLGVGELGMVIDRATQIGVAGAPVGGGALLPSCQGSG
jgi:hypothetical protein